MATAISSSYSGGLIPSIVLERFTAVNVATITTNVPGNVTGTTYIEVHRDMLFRSS